MVTCVTKMNVTIRGIRKEICNELKAEAVRRGLNIGEAVSEALQLWVERKKEIVDVVLLEQDPLWQLIRNPVDWGVETDASRVDEELYGLRRSR